MNTFTLAVISFTLVFNAAFAATNRSQQSNATYDVIVIGAGASGVAALSRLHRAGLRVLGIEAEGRVGGRVNTQDYGTGVVEFGAEWIHGEQNNAVYELATAANIHFATPSPMAFAGFHSSNGSHLNQQVCAELLEHLSDAFEEMQRDPVQMVEEYMNQVYEDYLKNQVASSTQRKFYNRFNAWFKRLAYIYDGVDNGTQISTKGASEFEYCKGPINISWKRMGYRTLFDILLNKTSSNPSGLPIDIILNSEVVRVNWSPDPTTGLVSVEKADGTLYHASTIIVTVSLGVLQERHKTWFNPPLPASKVEGINLLEIGTVGKLCLRYETIWWKERNDLAFIWTEEDLEKLADEDKWLPLIYGAGHPEGTDDVLTLWLTGEAAKLAETLPLDVAKEKLDWLIEKFCRPHFPDLQDSAELRRSTWYSNPHFRGSYSFHGIRSDAVTDPTAALRAPLQDPRTGAPLLLFAGEATNKKHYSTVHGAVESGWREADRILAWRAKKVASASQD